MACSNFRAYLTGGQVRAKKYFYVLRPVLACRWILDRGTPPPMLFTELMEAELSKELMPEVTKLLDLKINASEVKSIPRIDVLNRYLLDSIEEVQNTISSLPDDPYHDWAELDAIFMSQLD